MYAVYALKDPRNNEVFYVGIAKDVYERFGDHLRSNGCNLAKEARIQELKAANIMLIMDILQHVEGIEEAKKREAYWIRHFLTLGAPLTNQVLPLIQEDVVIVKVPAPVVEKPKKSMLKSGMTKEEQKECVLALLKQGLSRQKIRIKVDGFIHPKMVDKILDEQMLKSLVEPANKAEVRQFVNLQKPSEAIPEEMRSQIEAAYNNGAITRQKVQDKLNISGEKYWMLKTVCDEIDARKERAY